MAEIKNRVAASGIRTIDPESFYPACDFAEFDLKDYLFQGLILREGEFRDALAGHDWTQYSGKTLLVFCSTDAIIPPWAPMLVTSLALPYAAEIFAGNLTEYLDRHYARVISEMDLSELKDARVVIKGCSSRIVPQSVYPELVKRLQPVVRSLMYGEPCSTVPVYKRQK